MSTPTKKKRTEVPAAKKTFYLVENALAVLVRRFHRGEPLDLLLVSRITGRHVDFGAVAGNEGRGYEPKVCAVRGYRSTLRTLYTEKKNTEK